MLGTSKTPKFFCVDGAVLEIFRNSLFACISLGGEKSGFLSTYNIYFHSVWLSNFIDPR